MKRPIAIILLLLILFNTLGYYGLYPLLRLRATRTQDQRVDAGAYQATETITLKLPLNLPYLLAGQGENHRLHGSIRYQGNSYTLVSQRIDADTLYVVCLPNREERRVASLFARLADPMNNTVAAPLKVPKLPDNLDYLPAGVLAFNTACLLQKFRYPVTHTPRWRPPAQRIITPPPEQA
ncbi:hypothetical protein [Dawidia soli]|uniref:Uncharacterized protein n=1 Tax=Dawidia soli TaxID=2782352 RepID=A0AAP2GDG6_9BACT|nr:hypothetical protein [Dawidia soli]MBT1687319.1 hypothetical protein [Dawidia soli]